MGNRFGRNQKRRMREELQAAINNVEAVSAEKQEQTSRLREHAHYLETQVDRCRQWLGKNHPAFTADGLVVPYEQDSYYPLIVTASDGCTPISSVMMQAGCYLSDSHQEVHYRLLAGGKQFGYTISSKALQNKNKRELIKSITMELVEAFINEHSKLGGGRR